ncbi:MAG: short-chain fatty acyl-CoA regulator family protein [Sphingomonadaceae bacterium]
MARTSIYMGPRLKRLRRDLGLTQADMASDLDISPSYVALMERNQRPLTAELLLRLARTYRIDVGALADDDRDDTAARLQGVLKDPIFADIDLPALDIADIATSYPGFAEAILRLHTAFSEEQLARAAERETTAHGEGGSLADGVMEARNFLAARRNCFPALDDHAGTIGVDIQGLAGLVERLQTRHELEVAFVDPEIMLGAQRWHDSHRERLFISQLLDTASRKFQLALQLSQLEARRLIDDTLSEGRFETDNGRILSRRGLANYWAAALLMPYRPFRKAARRTRYDIEALSREFSASYEQIVHRLTTLQIPGEEGVPFFFIRLDQAGNVSKRLDGAGFPFARHGGRCPLWNVHHCFARPGHILTQRLELPDGQRFVSIARTVTAGGGNYAAPRATRAVALACTEDYADQLGYFDQLQQAEPTQIGASCHMCHRPHCIARSAPPIGREIRPDTYRDPGTPFAFAGD